MIKIYTVYKKDTKEKLEYRLTEHEVDTYIFELENNDRLNGIHIEDAYEVKEEEMDLPIKMGLSSLTNTIYMGETIIEDDSEIWHNKIDVTDQALTIVFEHLYNKAKETGHFEMYLKGYGKLAFDIDNYTSSIDKSEGRVIKRLNKEKGQYDTVIFEDLKDGDIFQVYDNEKLHIDEEGYDTWKAVSDPYLYHPGILTIDVDFVKRGG